MRWIFLVVLGFQVQLVIGQRPTFIKSISYINGNDINWQKGLFQQTDSTYVGIYTASAGSDQQSPYYVIYDLEGNVLKEEIIQINIPHFTYFIGDVVQTSDSGIIIHGESDIIENGMHCVKYDKFMNEEWRIVSNKYDSVNGKELVPIYSISKNDTIYSLATKNYSKYYITTSHHNSGNLIDSLNIFSLDSNFIEPYYVNPLYSFKNKIFFNSFKSIVNSSYQVLFSLNSLKTINKTLLNDLVNYNYSQAFPIWKMAKIIFRDSVFNNMELYDVFDSNNNQINTIKLPFQKSAINVSEQNYFTSYFTCRVRLFSDSFSIHGTAKFLDVILKIDSLGQIINYLPIGKVENGVVKASYRINKIQQFDDGYYAIYLWSTPGVARTPFYMIVTDSNLNVNGKYFLDYFNSMNIEEQKTEIESFVYPNPSSTEIFISNFKESSNFSIYDLNGKIKTSGLTRNTIDISNLKEGVYILEVISNNGKIERHKIIKK